MKYGIGGGEEGWARGGLSNRWKVDVEGMKAGGSG